jgi:hypothetical protein
MTKSTRPSLNWLTNTSAPSASGTPQSRCSFSKSLFKEDSFLPCERQHKIVGQPHCGTLDRLHLAAMELLGISRLLTHDNCQAQAARGLGFEVVVFNG